jgi:hypothetical protein
VDLTGSVVDLGGDGGEVIGSEVRAVLLGAPVFVKVLVGAP